MHTMLNIKRLPHTFLTIPALLLIAVTTGCLQPMPDRAERMTRGCIYYFDGAGGGGVTNWAGGVRKGMVDAGYNGAGELVGWNTGLGVLADQESSAEYKRGKAAEAAQQIQQYTRQYPDATVTLIGLSAGTAVTVFTLEELPETCPVENVVLLGASISADYDLTKALKRVRGKVYVFTSERDAVLAFAVTAAGTADRSGTTSAGLNGFRMPSRMTAETRTQYAKVVNTQWRSEFITAGNLGGHTDTVKAPFVQEYIAPLIMAGMARTTTPLAALTGKVANPDYERWARFGTGSWVTYEGYQVVNGSQQPMRITATLISKHQDRLVVERTYSPKGGNPDLARVQQFVVQAQIAPSEHPLTNPSAKVTNLPSETLTLAGRSIECRVRTVQAAGEFPEYGRGIWAKVSQSDLLPGGMAKVWLKSSKGDQPFEFRGEIVGYGTR